MNNATQHAFVPPPQAVSREVHLDQWVAPSIADERGELRAGTVLEWMDVVGVLAATRHSRRPVVTVSVDAMELRQPIHVGERVTMTATVGFTSEKSLGICVSMTAGFARDRDPRRFDGYMTFVALGPDERPSRVPQLSPETPAEVARFREGQIRREFRKKLEAGQLPTVSSHAAAIVGAARRLARPDEQTKQGVQNDVDGRSAREPRDEAPVRAEQLNLPVNAGRVSEEFHGQSRHAIEIFGARIAEKGIGDPPERAP